MNPTIDDKYILEKYLGYGGTSKVFLGTGIEGKVAIKIVRKDKNFTRKQEQILISNE